MTSQHGHLAANATTITINGFGFDPTAGNNTVTFNDGAVGTVTTATATSLTVTFSTKPDHGRQPDRRGHDRQREQRRGSPSGHGRRRS